MTRIEKGAAAVGALIGVLGIVGVSMAASTNKPVHAADIVTVDATQGVVIDGVHWSARRANENLYVFPVDADWSDPTFPSVTGDWQRTPAGLRFQPRYPFAADGTYGIVLRARETASDARLLATFAVPVLHTTKQPTVVGIYPTTDTLPENQLKMFVHFSAPMLRGVAYDHIRLLDADTGEEMEAVFHAMRDGLWDGDGKRLTIVFDPGRVKRGLANRNAWGPPIVQGRNYRLVIDSIWPGADGLPVAASFEKVFTVTAPDRKRPGPNSWRVIQPTEHTRDPVVLVFEESMDHALLQSTIHVTDTSGLVHGDVTIPAGEKEWVFTPVTRWERGRYRIVVDCQLEDLAGNNLVRLFDADLMSDDDAGATHARCPTEVPFTITTQ